MKIISNTLTLAIVLFALIVSIIQNAGCTGMGQSRNETDTSASLKKFLHESEQKFDPTQYEIPITFTHPKAETVVVQHPVIDTSKADSALYGSGFRVQVITTLEFDKANQVRDSVQILLPTEWIYTVYLAPSYKIRVGNFTDRPAANKMVKLLLDKGFNDAWVVPDKIILNPPIKLPPVHIPIDTLQQH